MPHEFVNTAVSNATEQAIIASYVSSRPIASSIFLNDGPHRTRVFPPEGEAMQIDSQSRRLAAGSFSFKDAGSSSHRNETYALARVVRVASSSSAM